MVSVTMAENNYPAFNYPFSPYTLTGTLTVELRNLASGGIGTFLVTGSRTASGSVLLTVPPGMVAGGNVIRLWMHYDGPPVPRGNGPGNPPLTTPQSNISYTSVVSNVLQPVDQQYVALSCDTDGAYAATYRYGFNGQQKDDEVAGKGNSLDFKYRGYDPRLGRFTSVDPLSSQFPYLTPFQFASNSPIQAIDLDGLEGVKATDLSKHTTTIKVQVWYTLSTDAARPGSNMTKSEVDAVESGINKELNKKKFFDPETGNEVVFEVVFSEHSMADVRAAMGGSNFDDVQNPRMFLRKIPSETSTSTRTEPDGATISTTTTVEGKSEWRQLKITNAWDGHTNTHELFHNLIHNHKNAPAALRNQIDPTNQAAGHRRAGGIFVYEDEEAGTRAQDVNQQNVTDALSSVPEERK